MSDEKPYTFKELKADLEGLSEEQLAKRVILMREEEGLVVAGLEELEEDVFYNKDETEDRGTLKELQDRHGAAFNEADYLPGATKGTPFLREDF